MRETQLYGFEAGSIRLSFIPQFMSYTRFEDNSAFQRKAVPA